MKRILVALLVFLPLSAPLFAQEGQWFLGKPIIGFQFSGLKAVTQGELLALLAPYKDKPFSYDLYWEMQNKLYAIEYFESVAADAIPGDPEKKTVIVNFQVKERPIVLKIIFTGNNSIPEKDLKDAILIKERSVYSEAKLRVDVEAIKGVYKGKGFLDAEVSSSFTANKDGTMLEVTFTIKEGPKTTVKKILFSGNQFASEGTLKGLIQTKEPALFVNSDFQENKLKEDTAAIVDYYTEHGYYFAKVEKVDRKLEYSEAEQRKFIVLTFYISEGSQYTYGTTTFQGNNIFPVERLAPFFRQKKGEIINKRKVREDLMKVSDLYLDNGYITTQVNTRERVDEGKREISFEIAIVEGGRTHIGRIIILGNTKTKEAVIRRELPFEEGDVFNKAKIQRGIINLMRSGYFSRNIIVEPSPGSDENIIDIVITVEETPTAKLEMGGSIVPAEFPFTAYANLVEQNFMGLGISAGLNLNLTPIEQSLAVFYENGWLFGRRLLGGINFSVKHEIVKNVPEDSIAPFFYGSEDGAAPDPFNNESEYYDALDSGEGIPVGYTMQYHSVQFRLGLTGGYTIETAIGLLGFRIEPSMALSFVTWDPTVDRPFSYVLRSELNQWLFINRLGLTVSLNGTDIPHNPEAGYFLAQTVSFTGDFLLGSRHYIRLSTEAEAYLKFFDIPVSESWRFKLILALHSQINFLVPPLFRPMMSVEEDYYRVDGMFVGRGWNLRSRGKVLWDNKLELRMPIFEEGLWWTVFFFDAVGLWQGAEEFGLEPFSEDNFFFSMGSGIRLTIPGVPIRLYLAKRFKIVDGNVVWQDGALKFWEGASLDLVFSIDINPF